MHGQVDLDVKTESAYFVESILDRFKALIHGARLGHAYLFVGPEGIGKSETARAISKLLNCERSLKEMFCGECPACLKIERGIHPDVHFIACEDADDKTIKIEQIRRITNTVQLRPFEAKVKVFIIPNIEYLTPEAANAFLKTLEEPVANNLIILTTAFPERVLGTIHSRCHIVRFFPADTQTIKNRLAKDYSLDSRYSHFLACFSGGTFGRAVRHMEQKMLQTRDEVIDNFACSPYNPVYLQKILADKNKTKESLEILLAWFRDLMLLKLGINEARLINIDRAGDLKTLQSKYSFVELNEIIEGIIQTIKTFEENLNMKVSLAILKEKLWRK